MKSRKLRYSLTAFYLSIIFSSNSSVANDHTIYFPSSWASEKIAISETAGITPEGFDTQPFNQSITRKDFCELLLNTCRTFGIPLPTVSANRPFSDTTDINVEYAYTLGLTQGTATGIFSPELPLTREMAAVMLSKLRMLFQYNIGNSTDGNLGTISPTDTGSLSYTQPMDEYQATKTLSAYSSDSHLISDWAKSYMADVYTRGILLGTGEGKLDPSSYITREQAVILSLNVLTYCDESKIRSAGINESILPMPTGIFISKSYYWGDVYLHWNDIPSASAYEITLFKNGTLAYTTRIENNYFDLRTSSSTYNHNTKSYNIIEFDNPLFVSIFGKEKQTIEAVLNVVPVNSNGELSMFSLTSSFTINPWVNKNEMIFGDPEKTSFSSNEEAMLNMTNVEVNIWKLNSSGTKTTSTLSLTVNKNVAEDVKNIFADIYNGPEKFPIKNCGAYSYRSGTSEHSSGTAIDINYEENYFVSWEGTIKVGTLWDPSTNPFSLPSDGDVVRAFNKYDWHWSPDMRWPNGADYMHFSLGGK